MFREFIIIFDVCCLRIFENLDFECILLILISVGSDCGALISWSLEAYDLGKL